MVHKFVLKRKFGLSHEELFLFLYLLQDSIKSHKPKLDHSVLVKKNPFSKLTVSERKDDRRETKKVVRHK